MARIPRKLAFAPYGTAPPDMAADNSTDTFSSDSSSTDKNASSAGVAIAAALPALFAIILLVMIVVALLVPAFAPRETPESKEERRKKRLVRLNKTISSQKFRDWRTKEIAEHPDAVISAEPLCVICLETIEEKALVRGLSCLHVFHQQCLDSWYGRSHEYCPLCHRPILPPTAKAGEHSDGRSTDLSAVEAQPSEPVASMV